MSQPDTPRAMLATWIARYRAEMQYYALYLLRKSYSEAEHAHQRAEQLYEMIQNTIRA